jgi:hypothetical protein
MDLLIGAAALLYMEAYEKLLGKFDDISDFIDEEIDLNSEVSDLFKHVGVEVVSDLATVDKSKVCDYVIDRAIDEFEKYKSRSNS